MMTRVLLIALAPSVSRSEYACTTLVMMLLCQKETATALALRNLMLAQANARENLKIEVH